MSTEEVMRLLRAKYAPPSYSFVTEVGNSTGANCRRHADGVAMGIWPSRGMELEGFEVKASRSDWRRELENPAKAEPIFQFCDRWWVVAGDESIVKEDELPPTWGLMVAKTRLLKVVVKAPRLTPKPVTRGFLAAIFRRCTEQSADTHAAKKAYEEGYQSGKNQHERFHSQDLVRFQKLTEKVREFEKASGVSIEHSWEAGNVGRAVQEVLNGGLPLDKIRQVMNWVSDVQRSGIELIKELEANEARNNDTRLAPAAVQPLGGPALASQAQDA